MLSQNCLDKISSTTKTVHFLLKLDSLNMANFKEQVLNLPFEHFDIEEKMQYVTLPDENGIVTLEIAFPNYPFDEYKYFYPKEDFKFYLPKDNSNKLILELDETIDANPIALKSLTSNVRNDINQKFNPNKLSFWFADAREEQFESKEWRSSSSIYSSDGNIIGWVHKFSGNMTFTGHQNCDKIDFAKITYYKKPNDEVTYLDLRELDNESILPIKEGKVFFKKVVVDYERLEFCQLLDFMCDFCLNYGGKIQLE